jgi:uncharacterized HhH-GPD family protein
MTAQQPTIRLAQDVAADELLATDPFALLVGMLLDQQVPMEKAFSGPYVIRERFGSLEPEAIAGADPEAFAALMSERPAVHRFPGAMAKRVQELARIVVDDYAGDATAIWSSGDARAVLGRLQALPGFGDQKARIFLALLGKQYAVRPRGWRDASDPFGAAGTYISVADIRDDRSLSRVRDAKRSAKAAAKAAADPAALRPEVRRRVAKDAKIQK